jgi:hypothetical protein
MTEGVQSLSLQWTYGTLVVSILAFLATAALSWLIWRRSGHRRAVGLLELLRLFLVLGAVLLLNQPEWIEQYRPSLWRQPIAGRR